MGLGTYLEKDLRLLSTISLAFRSYRNAPHTRREINGMSLDPPMIDRRIAELLDYDNSIQLDAALQNQFETAFGTDLSKVRIHTGAFAEALTHSRNAAAITIGHDIYFSRGHFSPDTEAGIALLAHELQHVAQYQQSYRFIYHEDISKAEYEASRVEYLMQDLRLHAVREPLLDQSASFGEGAGASGSDQIALMRGTASPADESIDDFAGRHVMPVFEIVLNSGETIELTKKEMSRVYEEFAVLVTEYLQRMRRLFPDTADSEPVNRLIAPNRR